MDAPGTVGRMPGRRNTITGAFFHLASTWLEYAAAMLAISAAGTIPPPAALIRQ